MTDAWLSNDELFRREAAEGHQWEDWFADRLRRRGIAVNQAEHRIRDDVSERDQWRNEIDMVANGVPLEVKSRRCDLGRYTGQPLNVCSQRAWRAKGGDVRVWVVLSRLDESTPRILACSSRTVAAYGIETTSADYVRGMSSYSVIRLPWDRWVGEDTLMHWLSEQGAP